MPWWWRLGGVRTVRMIEKRWHLHCAIARGRVVVVRQGGQRDGSRQMAIAHPLGNWYCTSAHRADLAQSV